VPTPDFIVELRSLIGTRPLWLSVAIAVVVDGEGRVLREGTVPLIDRATSGAPGADFTFSGPVPSA
jgi:hypothetical protein